MNADGGRRVAARLAPMLCALAVFGILVGVRSGQPAGAFWDDGVYLITARALATGAGYHFTHLPGAAAAVHFPPAWPLLLSLVWRAAPDFPANLAVFRLVNPVLAACAAGLVCAYGTRRLRLAPVVSAVVAAVFAATLPVLVLDSVLFAEPLFLVLTVATLFAADRAVDDGGARAAAIAGLSVGAAMLTRSIGFVLLPAVVGALLLGRRPRNAALVALVALVVAAPWQWWSSTHATDLATPLRGNYGPYVPWLAAAVRERGAPFVAAIVRQNLASIERSFAVVFFPVGVRPLRPLLVALLCVVVALGFGAAWRRARTLCLLALFYALIVVVWPYAPDRFAWAVWPLVGLVIAAGASAAWAVATRAAGSRGSRVAAAVVLALAVFAVGGDAFYSARGVSRGWADIAQRRNAERLTPVVDWVNRHTDSASVVACDGEPLVHLYTGRRVVPVHVLSPDEYLAATSLRIAADDLRSLLAAGHADYTVLSAGSPEISAAPLLGVGSGSPRLVPVDTLPGGGVAYRVDWSP